MQPHNENVTQTAHLAARLDLTGLTRLPHTKHSNTFTRRNSAWSLVARFLQGQWKNNPATNTLLSGHEAIFLVM